MQDPRLDDAIIHMKPTAESLGWVHAMKAPPGTDLDELQSVALEALAWCAANWLDYCGRNGFEPWTEDGSAVNKFFLAYSLRRMRGALADYARSQDWLTRNTRSRVKAITAARDAGAHSEAELAAATGLTVKQVRRADAEQYHRPVALDVRLAETGDHGDLLLVDPGSDVESQAAVSVIVAGFLAALAELDTETQIVLALVYHQEVSLEVAAKELRLELGAAKQLHDAGVLEVHNALLRAVV